MKLSPKIYAWKGVSISLYNVVKQHIGDCTITKCKAQKEKKAFNKDKKNLHIHHPYYNEVLFCCETVFTKHCTGGNH